MTSSKSETFFTVLILILILFSSFFLRNRGTPNIPAGQLTVPDGYFYYWQAQLISKHGKLPERDMHRWLPLGRDNGQTLNLYGYAIAYTHKLLAHVFPNVSLYQVTFYASVVCFCTGLATLYLFLSHTFGLLFSSSVGVLLATLPGTIERSTAGLGDRDAWCLMLGIVAITTYLTSLQIRSPRGRLLWTLISGFTVFLGGISWEGFGVFLSIILFVELWRYLSSETEKHLGYYCLWMLTFVPTLYLASPAYRSGYGFSKYLFAFMLAPTLVLLGMRILRYLIFTKAPWADILKPHARLFTLALTLMSLAIALGYIFIQRKTFADTTIPLSQNMLMKTVAELGNPFLKYWMFRYGSVFILGALATVMVAIRFWKTEGLLLAMPLILFTLTTFYRSQLDKFWGETIGNILFGISILTCLIGFIILAWQRQHTPENEQTYIAFMLWFLFWIALSRDAKRYDFFIGVSVAFFTTDLIRFLADFYGNKVKQRFLQHLLKITITLLTLTLIMFWTPTGGHVHRSLLAASHFHRTIPGNSITAHTFEWIKSNLPPTAVVAARWDYGSMLNVLAGVKTIIDQDHYIQHWIHLYDKHVRKATSEREALEFLKTHNVTHLILTHKEPAEAPFLRGKPSKTLVPVYPTENFTEALIKLWEINYPPDIQPNPKYLETGFPKIDKDLQLQ